MKTSHAILLVAAGVASFGLSGAPATAQPSTTETSGLKKIELQRIKTAVARPISVNINAITRAFTGSFEDVPAQFDAFRKEFEAQGLNKKKLPSAPIALMIVDEDPKGKSSFKMRVGVQVPVRLEAKEPLKMERIEVRSGAR